MEKYKLADNKSISKILTGKASLSFLIKATGAGLAFLMQIILARLMGESEYGIYTSIVAWIMIAVIISPLGVNKTAVKFIPTYLASKQFGLLTIYIKKITSYTLLLSITSASLIYILLIFIKEVENNYKLAFISACLLIPINSLIQVCMEIMRGFRKVIYSEFLSTVLRPLLLIFSTIIWLVSYKNTPTSITIFYLNSAIGLFILVLLLIAIKYTIQPFNRHTHGITIKQETKKWILTAIPLLLVAAGNIIQGKTDIIMLGMLSNTTHAGHYNAASSISQLIGMPLLAINTILAPIIAQLFAEGQKKKLQHIVRKSAFIAFLSSLSLAILISLLGYTLLSFFGHSFTSQTNTLNILLSAQVISGMAGPAGYLLAMTNNQNILAIVVFFSTFVNIVLNYFLIPIYGPTGAALATATSIALANIIMSITSIIKIKINPTIIPGKINHVS